VFICRLVPGIRSLISIPAGIDKINLAAFLLYTAVGAALWTALLAYAGYLPGGSFSKVEQYLNPASYVVLGVLVMWYVVRVIKHKGADNEA
jgi:membrane protein DedA with SNARE-associated domain